ncbi:hypothetical protein ACF06Q_31290 [Streptomyces leeuwenhoekii]|uniref:hypothetical protein n=1 Tax=Streptomyces leeuwenhoekii TaxID=1437453 RepID=UPI0037003F87
MRRTATITAALAPAAGDGLAMAPSATAATVCPSGAVPIRETDGSIRSGNNFYGYRAHNLPDETGRRVIVNHQTGGAGFQVCYEYDGGNCSSAARAAGEYAPCDMTPINPAVLVLSPDRARAHDAGDRRLAGSAW